MRFTIITILFLSFIVYSMDFNDCKKHIDHNKRLNCLSKMSEQYIPYDFFVVLKIMNQDFGSCQIQVFKNNKIIYDFMNGDDELIIPSKTSSSQQYNVKINFPKTRNGEFLKPVEFPIDINESPGIYEILLNKSNRFKSNVLGTFELYCDKLSLHKKDIE